MQFNMGNASEAQGLGLASGAAPARLPILHTVTLDQGSCLPVVGSVERKGPKRSAALASTLDAKPTARLLPIDSSNGRPRHSLWDTYTSADCGFGHHSISRMYEASIEAFRRRVYQHDRDENQEGYFDFPLYSARLSESTMSFGLGWWFCICACIARLAGATMDGQLSMHFRTPSFDQSIGVLTRIALHASPESRV